MERRSIGYSETGRHVERDVVGKLGHAIERNGNLLACPTPSGEGDDAIARREALRIRLNGCHHARHFGTRRERQGWLELILALNDQRVEKIEPDRLDRDDGLARTELRIGHVLDDQALRRPELLAKDGFHCDVLTVLRASVLPRHDKRR